METADPVTRVIASAYEAATDPARWNDVLRTLTEHCQASKAALFTPVEGATHRYLWADIGFDPALLEEYSNHWVKRDAWVLTSQAQQLYVAGNVIVGSSYVPWEELLRTEFFNDFAMRIGVQAVVSSVLFDARDELNAPRTNLSLFREPGEPEFGSDEVAFLQRVLPHLRRALEIYWALSRARAPHATLAAALDAIPQPVFVLRPDGFIDYANRPAYVFAEGGSALSIRYGRLIGAARNAAGLERALFDARRGIGGCLPLFFQDDRRVRGVVHIAPVGRNPAYASAWPAAVAILSIDVRTEEERRTALAALAGHFALTRMELKVLALLCEGLAPTEAASRLGIRTSTARSHLQSLFDKTGCHTQVELVRLLPQ